MIDGLYTGAFSAKCLLFGHEVGKYVTTRDTITKQINTSACINRIIELTRCKANSRSEHPPAHLSNMSDAVSIIVLAFYMLRNFCESAGVISRTKLLPICKAD